MKIDEYLRESGVQFEHHTHSPVYTAQEMAAEEHTPGRSVAKSVVVKAGEQFAICVLSAPAKLDLSKVGHALGIQHCRLAEESEMAKIFPDVEVGAEPPFGHLYNIPTLVDEELTHDEWILFPAGSHRDAIRMKFEDFARLAKPRIARLTVGA